jgi:hypothetical protein
VGDRTRPSDVDLGRECAAIARYLTGHTPTGYVLAKYRDAHARHEHLNGGSAVDRFLLRVARTSTAGAWLVDCYTALFARTAVVRRKSVLVVALLESSAPSAEYFDSPDRGGAAGSIARLGLRGALFSAGVLGSIVLLAPIHALLLVRSKWTG